ncbi:hypothetical protein OG21DRAFT_1425191, partial [Imleria badia]
TSTLAALAQTCRTFKEPALDELWGTLDDLTPLAQCLPEASDPKLIHAYEVRWFHVCITPCLNLNLELGYLAHHFTT